MFHDLASVGVPEPVLRFEREQPRDDMFEAVPPDGFLWPFVIQCQDIMEHQLVGVSLEWLDTKTQNMLDNAFGYTDDRRENHKW